MRFGQRATVVMAIVVGLPSSAADARARHHPDFQPISGSARITDGDTIRIGRERIRFFGIDAPEMHQSCIDGLRARYACGERAREALRREIGTAPVTCNPVDIDRYRRLVARCYARGEDLNRWMVANGWAVAYRQFSRDYVPDEGRAKAMRLGMWNGEFELPSTWRVQDRRQERER